MELGSIGMFFQISALILSLASVAAYAYTYFIPSKLPINNNTKPIVVPKIAIGGILSDLFMILVSIKI